jgi:hypothetical protein
MLLPSIPERCIKVRHSAQCQSVCGTKVVDPRAGIGKGCSGGQVFKTKHIDSYWAKLSIVRTSLCSYTASQTASEN